MDKFKSTWKLFKYKIIFLCLGICIGILGIILAFVFKILEVALLLTSIGSGLCLISAVVQNYPYYE